MMKAKRPWGKRGVSLKQNDQSGANLRIGAWLVCLGERGELMDKQELIEESRKRHEQEQHQRGANACTQMLAVSRDGLQDLGCYIEQQPIEFDLVLVRQKRGLEASRRT